MASMNISFPKALRVFVERQVTEGGFASASEYVRMLVRRQKELESEALERALVEGIESGPAAPMTARDWAALRRRAAGRRGASPRLRRRA